MSSNCERWTSECNDFPPQFNTRAGRPSVGAVNRRTHFSINGTPAVDDFAVRMSASRARVAALCKRAAPEVHSGCRRDDTTHSQHSGSAAGQGSAEPRSDASAWPTMDEAAYQGLAREVVEAIKPHSEADPVAILIQFLALAGNAMGRTAYYLVEDDRHHTNLFAVLVGESSKARKGTSLGRVRAIMKIADQGWSDDRLKGGLSSGEGLINEVRDQRKEWNRKEGREEIVDPGISDKRLMIVEPEFAGALAVAERHGNTISTLIRRAWDGDKLQSMTKNSPLCATDPHISLIGHITEDELRARLTRTDMANGFANRFLFVLIRRSKELPLGGALSDGAILHLGEHLKEAVEKAKRFGRVRMTDAATAKWC